MELTVQYNLNLFVMCICGQFQILNNAFFIFSYGYSKVSKCGGTYSPI
jgi:hypothetical protein